MGVAARWQAWERRGGARTMAGPLSPITYPATRLRSRVEIAPGADLTAHPSTWSWVDITQWVRNDLGITTTVGRRDQAGVVDPGKAMLKLDNRDGRFSRRNPLGPYYGQLNSRTPIRMGVDPGDGVHYRYHGFVNEWPKRWERKASANATVPITCSGFLRRLQRQPVLRSALFRTMSGQLAGDFIPHAYWPMEDGSDASQFASGLPGGQPMTMAGAITPATDSSLAGSAPLPRFEAGAQASARVPNYTETGQWAVQFALKIDAEPGAETTYAEIRTTGTARTWRVYVTPGSPAEVGLAYYDAAGTLIASSATPLTGNNPDFNPSEDAFFGSWVLFTVASADTGATYDTWSGFTLGDDVSAALSGGVEAGDHGSITSIKLSGVASGVGFGHVGVWVDPDFRFDFDDADQNASAMHGHAGEMAHERIRRICAEEGIQLHCTAAASAAVGPQPVATVLDILRDAEKADQGGVLYEHGFGLGYQPLLDRVSQPVQLQLDFDAGHINGAPEADSSDLRYRNRWTVSRINGSEATATAEGASEADGIEPGQIRVNAYRDAQLEHIAGWLTHRDSVDEDTWTGLNLNLGRTPDLIPQWTSLPFGARLTAANPPEQADPGDIDAIVEGWTERWDQVDWTAALNTSPASVLEVPIWDDPGFLWDSGSSSLTSDITDSATSISVTTTNEDDLWITGTVDFDIGIGGEQLTVTNISGATSPQTFTVVRAVNGITKAHDADSPVSLWDPPIWGL